jgi:hypothetical protein
MILFAIPPFAPAASPRPEADDLANVATIDMTIVPAAWPVAVSDLAQRFMACQVREIRYRRV